MMNRQQKHSLMNIAPKSSKEEVATDYLLSCLALLEAHDKLSDINTIEIRASIEDLLAARAGYNNCIRG